MKFEEEQFENVSDLITFYQTHSKPITRNSGCIIKNPVPNTTVHTFKSQLEIDQNYMKILRPEMFKFGQERSLSQKILLNETRKQLQLKATEPLSFTPSIPLSFSRKSHLPLSDLLSRPLPKPIPSPVKDDQDEYSEIDYDAMEETTTAVLIVPEKSSNMRRDGVLDASMSNLNHSPNHELSLISSNSVRSELKSASYLDVSKLHWRMPRSDSFPILPKRKVPPPIRDSGYVVDNSDYDQPKSCTTTSITTAIDFVNYRSPFIELNDKPQTNQLLERFRQLLLMKKPESCAELITAEDCRLLRFEKNLQVSIKDAIKFERLNGLSLILLPHGQNVRNDLLERLIDLNILLEVTKVPGEVIKTRDTERSAIYDTWMQIAHALFYQYGNAFSFLTLLDALCSDFVKSIPIQEYSQKLQQELESIARKFHRCESLPLDFPKINIPFMQPLLNILSNDLTSSYDIGNGSTWATEGSNILPLTMDQKFAQNDMWKWLQEGRRWVKRAIQLGSDSSKLYNENISHSNNFLSTEFSLKVLFGSEGISMDTKKRYYKLAVIANSLKVTL
ncbi:SH2 domain-containing protein 3C [Dirofilaria immitis]|nr:SH2 domain-containing protein 3C [Dirofilaria immitis]